MEWSIRNDRVVVLRTYACSWVLLQAASELGDNRARGSRGSHVIGAGGRSLPRGSRLRPKSPTSSLRLVFDVAMWQALGHAQSVRNGSVAKKKLSVMGSRK